MNVKARLRNKPSHEGRSVFNCRGFGTEFVGTADLSLGGCDEALLSWCQLLREIHRPHLEEFCSKKRESDRGGQAGDLCVFQFFTSCSAVSRSSRS